MHSLHIVHSIPITYLRSRAKQSSANTSFSVTSQHLLQTVTEITLWWATAASPPSWSSGCAVQPLSNDREHVAAREGIPLSLHAPPPPISVMLQRISPSAFTHFITLPLTTHRNVSCISTRLTWHVHSWCSASHKRQKIGTNVQKSERLTATHYLPSTVSATNMSGFKVTRPKQRLVSGLENQLLFTTCPIHSLN